MSRTYIPSAVRRLVYERAKSCCEYCLIPETAVFASHEIDHIIAEKHGRKTEFNNLALSCVLCNKYKGSDLASVNPQTNEIVPLYHPRNNKWIEHFEIKEGKLNPLTAVGRVTVCLLQLNRSDRVDERKLLLQIKMLNIPT